MGWGFGSNPKTYDQLIEDHKNLINKGKRRDIPLLQYYIDNYWNKTDITNFIAAMKQSKNDVFKFISEQTEIQTGFTSSYFAYAVWKNKLHVVELFLKSVPDKKFELIQSKISTCQKEDYLQGYTSFQVAVRKGYLNIVKLFLKSVPTKKIELLSNSICIAVLSTKKMFVYIVKVTFKRNPDIINYPNDKGETPLAVLRKEMNKHEDNKPWVYVTSQSEKNKLFDEHDKIKNKYKLFDNEITAMGAKDMSYESLVNLLNKDDFKNQMETFKTFNDEIKKRISAPKGKVNSLIGQSVFKLSESYNFLVLQNLELLLKYGATLNTDEREKKGTLQNNLKLLPLAYIKSSMTAKQDDTKYKKITEIQVRIQKMMANDTEMLSKGPPPNSEWSNVCIKF